MNRMSAAESGGGRFGKTKEADFAFTDQLSHGTDGVFDGCFGVDAVLVVQIDRVHAESLETSLAAGTNVFGLAADTADVGISFVADDRELCGEKNLVAAVADSLADENFVIAIAVNVCGVEEIDTKFNAAMNCGDGFGIIARAIKLRHAHTAQSHRKAETHGRRGENRGAENEEPCVDSCCGDLFGAHVWRDISICTVPATSASGGRSQHHHRSGVVFLGLIHRRLDREKRGAQQKTDVDRDESGRCGVVLFPSCENSKLNRF
jgi:hypothetical protein